MALSLNKKNTEKNAPAPVMDKVAGAESESQKPFVKNNFIFMGVSLLLIVVGFLLMTGSANDNPAQFNADIFSTRRIVIGPALAFIGFVAMAFSIVYSPKEKMMESHDDVVKPTSQVDKKD